MKLVCYLQLPSVAEFSLTNEIANEFTKARPDIELVNCFTEDEFIEQLPTADAVSVWVFKQEWFAIAPKLKYLCTPAAGRDYFKVVPPAGVEMRYGSFHAPIMAETVLGIVIGMSHRLLQNATAMRADNDNQEAKAWPRDAFTGYATRCYKKHAIILGFGHIGSEIGRLLKGIGCRITGVKRTIGAAPAWFDADDRQVTLDKLAPLLPFADHVICVLPSDTGAIHVVDKEFLSSLPPTAFIYNVGRGVSIDEEALAIALNEGKIAGAVLDVFEKEPLSIDSPLRTAKNCYLYPHVSAVSPDYLSLYLQDLAKEL
ncbi:MAG: hypothetical protein J6V41_07185 [Kiritimatiellae bacterium]|nr:hypothetical protein [Kiritimatiellia bacterium]